MRPLTSGGHRKWLNGVGEIVSRRVFHTADRNYRSYRYPHVRARDLRAALSIKLIEAEHPCRAVTRYGDARRIRGIDLPMSEGYLDS